MGLLHRTSMMLLFGLVLSVGRFRFMLLVLVLMSAALPAQSCQLALLHTKASS